MIEPIKWWAKLLENTAVATLSVVLSMWLAMTAAAQAPMPQTTIFRNTEGTIVGSATRSGNRTYFRDADGNLTSSTRQDANGVKTHFAPDGTVIGTSTVKANVTSFFNASGALTSTTTLETDGSMTVRDAAGKVQATAGKPSKEP